MSKEHSRYFSLTPVSNSADGGHSIGRWSFQSSHESLTLSSEIHLFFGGAVSFDFREEYQELSCDLFSKDKRQCRPCVHSLRAFSFDSIVVGSSACRQ